MKTSRVSRQTIAVESCPAGTSAFAWPGKISFVIKTIADHDACGRCVRWGELCLSESSFGARVWRCGRRVELCMVQARRKLLVLRGPFLGNSQENWFVGNAFSQGSRSFAFHPCMGGLARSIHTAPLTSHFEQQCSRRPRSIGLLARMAELADALDSGSSGETREGSSPFPRTTNVR